MAESAERWQRAQRGGRGAQMEERGCGGVMGKRSKKRDMFGWVVMMFRRCIIWLYIIIFFI